MTACQCCAASTTSAYVSSPPGPRPSERCYTPTSSMSDRCALPQQHASAPPQVCTTWRAVARMADTSTLWHVPPHRSAPVTLPVSGEVPASAVGAVSHLIAGEKLIFLHGSWGRRGACGGGTSRFQTFGVLRQWLIAGPLQEPATEIPIAHDAVPAGRKHVHLSMVNVFVICPHACPHSEMVVSMPHHGVPVQELVQDGEVSKDPVVFTQRVLDLRRKYAAIVADAFNGDRLFLQAVNHAFEVRHLLLHGAVTVRCLDLDGRWTSVAVSAVNRYRMSFSFSWILLHTHTSHTHEVAGIDFPCCIPGSVLCVYAVGRAHLRSSGAAIVGGKVIPD